MKPLEMSAFLDYRFLSGLTWSPSGEVAAAVVTTACEKENRYLQHLWLYRNQSWKPFTGLGKEGSFLWDGDDTILFAGARLEADAKQAESEEITVVNRISIHGGEAQRAFILPVRAKSILRIDAGRYLVTARCDANVPDYYKMTPEERAEVAAQKKELADYEIFDEIPFWANGGGFTNKLRSRLFLYEEENDLLTPITAPLFATEYAIVSGNSIVYAGEAYDRKPTFRSDLWVYDTITGKSKCLYHEKDYNIQALANVDGTIIMTASDCSRYGFNENPWFYTVCIETGTISLLAEADLSLGNAVNSDCRYGGVRFMKGDGDRLYFITTQRTASHLYCIDLQGNISPVLEREGSIDDFDVVDGKLLLTAMWDGALQEVYTLDAGLKAATQTSSFNEKSLCGAYIADPEPLTFSLNGVEIDGWIMKPFGYNPDKTYPAILNIHGGPKTIYSTVFIHEMQYWASAGYFVFYCNPEGSDGRGNEFADIRGKYGTKDYDAIMKFTDLVLEKYPQIDPERVGVTGGSYGGFMTNWIIGHTGRFAAAASQRSISNWTSFYGNSDIGTFFATDQMACDIYEGQEKMWWHSPLKYADQCTTPTLFIHSDQDYRCWIPEGMQMYVALADRGIEVRMCCFKGENHELSRSGKPKHRLKRLEEITNWMNRHLDA